jgi:hypothetical protein
MARRNSNRRTTYDSSRRTNHGATPHPSFYIYTVEFVEFCLKKPYIYFGRNVNKNVFIFLKQHPLPIASDVFTNQEGTFTFPLRNPSYVQYSTLFTYAAQEHSDF